MCPSEGLAPRPGAYGAKLASGMTRAICKPRNRRHRYPPNSGGATAPLVVEAVASERSARLRAFWGERPTVNDTANPRKRGCSYTPSEA